jgi:hypothetical protein
MNRLVLAFLVALALCASAPTAYGQRLAPAFPSAYAAALAGPAGSPQRAFDSHFCRMSPPLRIGFGVVGGAAAGWLAYELSIGILVAGEGATPDARVRRIRATMIGTGVVLGVVQSLRMSHACRA